MIIESVDAESSATLAEFDDTRTRQVTGMWFARVTFPKRRADIQGRVDIRPGIKHLHDATELTGHERGVTETSATVPQHGAPLSFPERRVSF